MDQVGVKVRFELSGPAKCGEALLLPIDSGLDAMIRSPYRSCVGHFQPSSG